jgi:vacuolar-type H+-ATPase subunit E/Vma4
VVGAGFYQIRECLAGILKTAVYSAVLRQLTEEALAELQNSREDVMRARMEVDPRDRALLERILSDMALQLPIDSDINCWGGLIASSEDGRVIFVNTLESRLERTTSYLRHCLTTQFAEAAKDEICLVTTMAMHACER